jgi:hypothetical protein
MANPFTKRYRFITIRETGVVHKRTGYDIFNNKDLEEREANAASLGGITWYPRWRCYAVNFDDMAMFNEQCLLDICDFIRNHAGKNYA